jgi:two-component system, NarL family, sensor histidine kinase UhpB
MKDSAPFNPNPRAARRDAHRDMVAVVLISAAWAFVCVRLNVSEALLGWTRQHESLQLDELPGILLVIALSLIWFSTRRHAEASRELELRRATEARLAEALAENQRLAQQYLDVQEYERKALARDLHDELGQYLNVIKLDALAVRDAVPAAAEPARSTADGMIENIDRVYAVVGSLIRELRPAGLDELGLAAALEHCIGEWRRRLGASIELSIECDLGFLDAARGLTLFRLVQEAMTNIARHAKASRVEIHLAARRGADGRDCVEVRIADDGCGADLGSPHRGLGLIGMRERAAAFGGTLSVASQPGAGFAVFAMLPVTADGVELSAAAAP